MGLTNLLRVDPEIVVERVVEGFVERARSARGRDRGRLLEKAKRLSALLSELQRSLEELERELAKPQRLNEHISTVTQRRKFMVITAIGVFTIPLN
jgi:hypothetical protein